MSNKLLILILIIILSSCKKELELPTWDVDLIFPIANSKIDIFDIINDSSISIEQDNNDLVSLVYEKELLNIEIDSFININEIVGETSTKLDSLKFSRIVIRDTTTMGSLLNDLPFGTTLFPNGSSTTIPNLQNIITNDTVTIDASDYFETMTLSSGDLSLTIRNDFPTDLSNISFSLINSINQNIIGTFSYPLIPSNTLQTQTVSIAGQTIDKDIIAILNNVDINESNGNVTIDYQDAILTKLVLENIRIFEATAYFPDQEITQKLQEHIFDLKGAQIHEIGIKEGSVSIFATSTITDTGRIVFNIPSLTKNGIGFTTENIVPPTNNGQFAQFDFNFDNYTLDLTGKENRIGGDTINTIYTELFSYIDSTGELVSLNQSDSFYYYTEFNIIPEYAKGYLGRDTITFGPESIELDQFNSILSGDIDFESVELNVNIENFIGADGQLTFFTLNSENTNNGTIANIGIDENTGNNILNNNYLINQATLSNSSLPIISSSQSITTDANLLLDILPNKLNFSGEFILNNQNNINYNQFVYLDKIVNSNINIKLPLSILADKIVLQDTIEINNSNDLEFKTIFLKIINGFPLSAISNLISLDENKNFIDSIIHNFSLPSATVEYGHVYQNSETTLEINNLDISNSSYLIFTTELSTSNINDFVNIYSHYNLELILSGEIIQTLGE
ncbi:MAG: hypothetical protein ACKVLD_06800 [Flavobacteriales bacterium]|jgi:hypothetical protein|tara:strand:- start:1951 stop:3990 length:2040 start_codon:yes stop_codon:yes gene_type:complete